MVNNISFKILIHNPDIDFSILKKIETLNINKLYNYNKRVIIDEDTNICIKFSEKNSELFFTSEIINKYIEDKHLIQYYGIIELYEDGNTTDLFGILMANYNTLDKYLENIDIDSKLLLSNILGIIDLTIKVRDKYDFIHGDLKINNILIKNDIFYLIDWEYILYTTDLYSTKNRPKTGNTEMYPFYDATSEEFFIHSVGVLIVRILGYNYNVTYKCFMKNLSIYYMLSCIPIKNRFIFENIINSIFNREYHKIEKLRDDINNLLILISKNG